MRLIINDPSVFPDNGIMERSFIGMGDAGRILT